MSGVVPHSTTACRTPARVIAQQNQRCFKDRENYGKNQTALTVSLPLNVCSCGHKHTTPLFPRETFYLPFCGSFQTWRRSWCVFVSQLLTSKTQRVKTPTWRAGLYHFLCFLGTAEAEEADVAGECITSKRRGLKRISQAQTAIGSRNSWWGWTSIALGLMEVSAGLQQCWYTCVSQNRVHGHSTANRALLGLHAGDPGPPLPHLQPACLRPLYPEDNCPLTPSL